MPSAQLLLVWVVHFTLTALPLVAGAAIAARCGVRSVVVCLSVGMAVCCGLGYLGFWAYLVTPGLGLAYSWAIPVVSAAALWWALSRRGSWGWLVRPVALWGSASLFITAIGFSHGGFSQPLVVARSRFSGMLPGDNELPWFWSQWFYTHGHHGLPPEYGDWLFSDRPPLQTGFELMQRPMAWSQPDLHYQVMGVVLQSLWVVGLWVLLLAARLKPRTRVMSMLVVLSSGLVFVNSFFVWPKLLPAALVLAAAALVWQRRQLGWRRGLLVAALGGLAMMGHGSSLFAAVPLAVLVLSRGVPDRRWWAAAAAGVLVVMVPWSLYQKLGDPPGDRLIKYQFADVDPVTKQGALSTVVDAYRKAGVDGALDHKRANYDIIFDPRPWFSAAGQLRHGWTPFMRAWRSCQFFQLVPMLGLWLLGPALMLLMWRRRRDTSPPERSFAVTALLIALAGAIVWGVMIFGHGNALTVLHIGTYVVPLLALVACVAATESVASWLAIALTAVWFLSNLATFMPVYDPLPGTRSAPWLVVVALVALAAYAALLVPPQARGRRRVVTAMPL